MDFQTFTLKKWDDIHCMLRHDWIYRGQKEAKRPLKTSLERWLDRYSIAPTRRPELEAEVLREFQRAYHNYISHTPEQQDTLEWLSLMQHHGAPTRLLDFSYSIYVAAYFALERADSDCVVWAIDSHWAYQQTLKNASRRRKKKRTFPPDKIEEGDEGDFMPFFMTRPFVPSACPINPYRLNERLRLQKGIFLIPGDVTVSFKENLCALDGYDQSSHLIRIIIPKGLQKLYYMNITRTSLFPGLDGYSSSLGVFHPQLKAYESEQDKDRTHSKKTT